MGRIIGMGVIAIFLLVFEVILMFTGGVYFEFNVLVLSVLIIVMINSIYLTIVKKLVVTYGVLKKWFKGEMLGRSDWKGLLISARQLLVVNYFLSFVIWILVFICNIIDISIPFEFATYSIQIVILFNGIIMAPGYILLRRKVED